MSTLREMLKAPHMRQYLYFCTSKASKVGTPEAEVLERSQAAVHSLQSLQLLRQYSYFCTSKASKLSTCICVSIRTFVPVKQVN